MAADYAPGEQEHQEMVDKLSAGIYVEPPPKKEKEVLSSILRILGPGKVELIFPDEPF